MKPIIAIKTAGNILLTLFFLLALFHLLIMTGLVPIEIVWGGQVNPTNSERILLELSAIIVLLLFALIIACKVGYLKTIKSGKLLNIGVWIVFFYMALNTVGNLLSGGSIENWIFTPLTAIMALLTLQLATGK